VSAWTERLRAYETDRQREAEQQPNTYARSNPYQTSHETSALHEVLHTAEELRHQKTKVYEHRGTPVSQPTNSIQCRNNE
jgi:hypothetical protein